MSFGTSYNLIEKGVAVLNFQGTVTSCFSQYVSRVNGGALIDRTVNVFIKKSYPPTAYLASATFTKEQVFNHVAGLNDSGFPLSVKEESQEYVVTLQEKDYISYDHVRTALDFLRMSWENDQNKILADCLAIPEEIRKQFPYCELLQIVGVSTYAAGKISNGHHIPSNAHMRGYGRVFSKEEYLSGFSKGCNNGGSYATWLVLARKYTKKDGAVPQAVHTVIKATPLNSVENLKKIKALVRGEYVFTPQEQILVDKETEEIAQRKKLHGY
jgi:hypothetical protein